MIPDVILFNRKRKISNENGALLITLGRWGRGHVNADDAAIEVGPVQLAALFGALYLNKSET